MKSTTTTFNTPYGTSRDTSPSTSTVFLSQTDRTTVFGTNTIFNTLTNRGTTTSRATETSRATTYSTTFDTSNLTNQNTTTVFNTVTTLSTLTAFATNTVVYERVTAAGTDTEVSSLSDHNSRYLDGGTWTEI